MLLRKFTCMATHLSKQLSHTPLARLLLLPCYCLSFCLSVPTSPSHYKNLLCIPDVEGLAWARTYYGAIVLIRHLLKCLEKSFLAAWKFLLNKLEQISNSVNWRESWTVWKKTCPKKKIYYINTIYLEI